MASFKRKILTPALHQQIVATVRAGCFPEIAAQACGVPVDLLHDWLERGNSKMARQPFGAFAREVRQAHAQARLRAEMEVLQADPKFWLEHGPGRERADQPGWSSAVKPGAALAGSHNLLRDPEVVAMFRRVLDLLSPYPDVRQRLAQSFGEHGLAMAA